MIAPPAARWNEAKAQVRAILIRLAELRSAPISYSALTAQIQAIHFHPQSQAFADLLSEISREEEQAGRRMLSALVVLADEGIPGSGFFELAELLGRDITDRDAMWVHEIAALYDMWHQQ